MTVIYVLVCQGNIVDGTQGLNCEVNQWMKSVLLFVDLPLDYNSCTMSCLARSLVGCWAAQILKDGKVLFWQKCLALFSVRETVNESSIYLNSCKHFCAIRKVETKSCF